MRKNGFTLIELLAIIVLLAVIALIATPQVLKLIENGQKNSFLRSVEGIVRTIRLDNSKNDYLAENYTIADGVIIKVKDGKNVIVKHEGGKNENGTISIDEDGKVSYAIHNNKWCTTMNNEVSNVKACNTGCSNCT